MSKSAFVLWSDWPERTSFLVFSSVKEPITRNPVPNEMITPRRPPQTDQCAPVMSSFVKSAYGMLVLMSVGGLQFCLCSEHIYRLSCYSVSKLLLVASNRLNYMTGPILPKTPFILEVEGHFNWLMFAYWKNHCFPITVTTNKSKKSKGENTEI